MRHTLLVTGGCGFVMAQVAVAWLEGDSESSAVVLDLPGRWDDITQELLGAYRAGGRLTFVMGDVTDPDVWKRCGLVTHVVHGAAVTPTALQEVSNPRRVLEVNLMGTLHALEYARLSSTVVRIICCSSDATCNAPDVGPDGHTSRNLYAVTKRTVEDLVARYRVLYQDHVDVSCVRFSDVWGQGDRDTGARCRHNPMYWAATRVAAGLPVRIRGNPSEVGPDSIDAVSVGKGVALLVGSRQRKLGRPLYNVTYGSCAPVSTLVEALGGTLQVVGDTEDADLVPLPADHYQRVSPELLSNSAVVMEVGWHPTPLAIAGSTYMQWLRGHPPRSRL